MLNNISQSVMVFFPVLADRDSQKRLIEAEVGVVRLL
jgi:hypothetical protein